MSIHYERISIDENTEVDWEGPGYYELRQMRTLESGEWLRWQKVAEVGEEQPDETTLAQVYSDLT